MARTRTDIYTNIDTVATIYEKAEEDRCLHFAVLSL